ncbi:Kinesin-like protein kif21b [Linnemannia zychae]|nr:Kinesin-like protein kif21b [Linnemannia zychae]
MTSDPHSPASSSSASSPHLSSLPLYNTKKRLAILHLTTPDNRASNNASKTITTSTTTAISDLPIEVAFLILAYLPYRALVSLSRVDHYWRRLTFHNNSALWYNLALKHGFLPRCPPPPPHSTSDWTTAYRSTACASSQTILQNRWTLEDAIVKRPGMSRALAQSRKRLNLSIDKIASTAVKPSLSSSTLTSSSPRSNTPTTTVKPQIPKICARLDRGEIETWRDYFEVSMILRREWISGKPATKELRGHEGAVICIKVLPGRDRVVTGDQLGYLKIWCAVTGTCLKSFKRHMMGVSCLSIHDDLLFSGSWDSTIIVWRQLQEAPYLKRVKVIDLGEQVTSMDLDRNLNLAIGTVGGLIMIVSTDDFSCLHTFRTAYPEFCTAVSLTHNKVEAVIGFNYYAWDRSTATQIDVLADPRLKNITCIKVDRTEKVLLTGSKESKVRMFSWESKPMLLRQYGGHRDGVRCITFQDDMILTGSADKTAMVTFRGRHDFCRADLIPYDALPENQGSLSDVSERVPESVSLPHSASVSAIDSDVSMIVTGDSEGVVRIFDFGFDLWRPAVPSSPRLCGQASLISSASPACVLMAKPGRSNVSIGNRRQTWGTSALAVLVRVKNLMNGSTVSEDKVDVNETGISSAWMNVDEIYQRMADWELLPVSQGSTPKHTLNLALHMMAKSDPPTVLLDSSVSPHRFALP